MAAIRIPATKGGHYRIWKFHDNNLVALRRHEQVIVFSPDDFHRVADAVTDLIESQP